MKVIIELEGQEAEDLLQKLVGTPAKKTVVYEKSTGGLNNWAPGGGEVPVEEEPKKKEPKKEEPKEEEPEEDHGIKIEDVRAILLEKQAVGFGPEIKDLVKSYGTDSLVKIDKKHYPELLEKARAL